MHLIKSCQPVTKLLFSAVVLLNSFMSELQTSGLLLFNNECKQDCPKIRSEKCVESELGFRLLPYNSWIIDCGSVYLVEFPPPCQPTLPSYLHSSWIIIYAQTICTLFGKPSPPVSKQIGFNNLLCTVFKKNIFCKSLPPF